MKIAVIIPAYNAGASIKKLLGRVVEFVPKSDIIVIDDGSTDSTAGECLSLGIEPLRHTKNMGKGAALRTGIAEALRRGYQAIITLDADGQHRPEHIPEFIKRFSKSGCQIVIGSRKQRFSELPFDRYLSNRLTTVVVSLLAGQKIEDSQSGYRLISTEALRSVPTKTDRYQMESELLIRAGRLGLAIGHVAIVNDPSPTSHIRRLPDTLRFLAMALRMLWI
jgi:glycosyltransferase involved in cell wall biosynthesis